MAESNKLDIAIDAGADFAMSFNITDNNDSVVDLTGAKIEAQLRQFSEANDYFPFTVTHSGITGRVKISMPHEMTAEIPFSSGVYDVKITFNDGTVKKPFYGEAYINPEVTRAYDGTILPVVAMESLYDLPSIGNLNRLYYIFETNEMYRWNGVNYVTAADPNSIVAVQKVSSENYTDKYRITFSNGNYSEYYVTNGRDGERGVSIASIEKTSTVGLVDTYTITLTNGNTETFTVTNGTNGRDGAAGSSIASIEKTATAGLVDTYTITLTNGNTETFTVTNGAKGERGQDGSGYIEYDETTETIIMIGIESNNS